MTEPAPVYEIPPPPALHEGDVVTLRGDPLHTRHVVVSLALPAGIVYLRPVSYGYWLVKSAADVLPVPEPRRAAFDAACWLEDPLP